MGAIEKNHIMQVAQEQADALLRHWLGGKVTCQEIKPLHGGYCSAVFRLDFDRHPYAAVVKLYYDSDDPLARERLRLDYLHQNTNVPCPQVYLQDSSRKIVPASFLILELLPGVTLESTKLRLEDRIVIERELANVLLDLHSHKRDTFGDIEEQPGSCNWADKFLPCLEENRRDMDGLLPRTIIVELDNALRLAKDAFRLQGEPTLIHNDVWGGNIMVVKRSESWHLSGLLDPVGLQYADVEKELAYLEAFDTVRECFFDAYTARQSLRPGYEFRKLFYFLNTYMIHLWLGFGREFQDYIVETARKIIAYDEKSECEKPDEK